MFYFKLSLILKYSSGRQNSLLSKNEGGEESWQGKIYFPYDLRLQDIHQLDLEEYDFRTLKRASLQLRLLQQLKTVSASSPTSASDQIRDSWEFLEQERDLSHLDYDEYHSRLASMIPHCQETLREILVMYRFWLSTPLQEADFQWIRRLVIYQLLPRDAIHLYLAESLWEQIKKRYGGDQGDLDQARGVLTISPLHDPVFDDFKNFAVALTLLTDYRHRYLPCSRTKFANSFNHLASVLR